MYSAKGWSFFTTSLAVWIGHILIRCVWFTMKLLYKTSFLLTYFSKDSLYYSESKYLIICCWKPCKNTSLFLKSFGDICHSLHSKWIMQWKVISFCGFVELESSFVIRKKKKKKKSEPGGGGMCWGAVSKGFFDSIISRCGTEHLLMPLISGQTLQVLLNLSNTGLLRECLWNSFFLQWYFFQLHIAEDNI